MVGREQLEPTALEHLSVAQRANSRNYKPVEVEDPAPIRLKQGVRQERKSSSKARVSDGESMEERHEVLHKMRFATV